MVMRNHSSGSMFATKKIGRDILSNKALENVLPMILTMVQNQGHCVPRDKVARVYGEDAIELAIYQKKVRSVTIVARDKEHKVPDQTIKALVTDQWDSSKPVWL